MPCPLSPALCSSIKNRRFKEIPGLIPTSAMTLFIAGMSVFSLIMAFTAQYGFNLRPCELCLIQRIPFALNIVIGITAYLWKSQRLNLISLAGLAFLINSCIAFFHSGVERKWWEGLTGCTTPDMSGSIEDVLKRIQETDVVRCDEIPWSFMGLSMANYNVAYCFGLAVVCIGYVVLRRQSPTQSPE